MKIPNKRIPRALAMATAFLIGCAQPDRPTHVTSPLSPQGLTSPPATASEPLKPALTLAQKITTDVTPCDPINLTITVANSGNLPLKDVVVLDELPSGLTSSESRNPPKISIPVLKPGESNQLSFLLKANHVGKFENRLKATCVEGAVAVSTATTTIRQALLQLSCITSPQRRTGQASDFCFTLSNTGDASTQETVLEASMPAVATVQGLTGGGRVTGGKLVWNIGKLGLGESREVCATLVSSTPGIVVLDLKCTASCAVPVNLTCQTTYE